MYGFQPSYLKDHFNRKDASEDIIKIGQNMISFTLFLDGIFGS